MAGFDRRKAEAVAREDWIEDSQGYFDLNYERFASSWFQLADLWTTEISVESYHRFLHDTLECLSFFQKTPGGERVRRLRPPHAIMNLKAYRKQKKRESLNRATRKSKNIWAMSLTSSKHKQATQAERVEAGLTRSTLEPPPVASYDPGGIALLEQWMERQLAAGCTKAAVKESLMQHAAEAPADSGLAKAASALTPGQPGGPFQKLVQQMADDSQGNPAAWQDQSADGLHRQPAPPRPTNSNLRPTSSGHYRMQATTGITADRVSYLARPKVPISRTKESMVMEKKMAQLINEYIQQASWQEKQIPDGSAPAQQSTFGAVVSATVAAHDLPELPSVSGQHAVHPRPQSERGPRVRLGAVGSTQRASSARGSSKAADNRNDEGRWAAEWVATQREEAARVMAARQAAQAARIVTMADIEHGLEHIARNPILADLSHSGNTSADKSTKQRQPAASQMPRPRSSRVEYRSVQPQWGVSASASTGKKLRTEKGRPLIPGGGWRDDSTKLQPNTVPPTLEGAALVSTSLGTEQGAHDGGYAGNAGRTGTRPSPVPTAAVLTQGGHVPGWLRYTTMMMRTMPLDQVQNYLSYCLHSCLLLSTKTYFLHHCNECIGMNFAGTGFTVRDGT